MAVLFVRSIVHTTVHRERKECDRERRRGVGRARKREIESDRKDTTIRNKNLTLANDSLQ